jgi:hypothetical protein
MDHLEHIHVSLAAALRRSRPGASFDTPVTVAEIYQDLVPYRTVRTQIGFDMNADYEHTLLRLLAGEGGYARLDPPEARNELRAELESANPNVGLFRKFAACDVWIVEPNENAVEVSSPAAQSARSAPAGASDAWESRAALWMDPAAAPEQTAVDGAETVELLLDDAIEEVELSTDLSLEPITLELDEEAIVAGAPAPTQSPQMEEPVVPTTTPEPAKRAAPAASTGACAFCDSALPRARQIRFCPFCGADQSLVPCGSCGEALEPDWKYCIACGAGAAAAG